MGASAAWGWHCPAPFSDSGSPCGAQGCYLASSKMLVLAYGPLETFTASKGKPCLPSLPWLSLNASSALWWLWSAAPLLFLKGSGEEKMAQYLLWIWKHRMESQRAVPSLAPSRIRSQDFNTVSKTLTGQTGNSLPFCSTIPDGLKTKHTGTAPALPGPKGQSWSPGPWEFP